MLLLRRWVQMDAFALRIYVLRTDFLPMDGIPSVARRERVRSRSYKWLAGRSGGVPPATWRPILTMTATAVV